MSPLSKYYRSLQQKAEQKKTSLQNSGMLVQEVKSKSMINDTVVSHEDYGSGLREGQVVFNKDFSPERSNGDASSKSKNQEKSHTVTIAAFEDNAIVEPRCSSSEENNDDLDNSEQDATGPVMLFDHCGRKCGKEVLPVQKLVNNFEAEYVPVASDGAFFTFQTNKNAPLVRVDLMHRKHGMTLLENLRRMCFNHLSVSMKINFC